MTGRIGPDVRLSDLEGPYDGSTWPGFLRGLSWAYQLFRHPRSNNAVLKCRYCDHAIQFPTYPEEEDKTNGVLWMVGHNYRHVIAGDVDPDDLGEELPIP